jgi:hypothetical protein
MCLQVLCHPRFRRPPACSRRGLEVQWSTAPSLPRPAAGLKAGAEPHLSALRQRLAAAAGGSWRKLLPTPLPRALVQRQQLPQGILHGQIFISKRETLSASMERGVFVSNRCAAPAKLRPRGAGSGTAEACAEPMSRPQGLPNTLQRMRARCALVMRRRPHHALLWLPHCRSSLDVDRLEAGMLALMHSVDERAVYGCFKVGGWGEQSASQPPGSRPTLAAPLKPTASLAWPYLPAT